MDNTEKILADKIERWHEYTEEVITNDEIERLMKNPKSQNTRS